MRIHPALNYLLAIAMLLQPVELFARGIGGGGGRGGGGGGGGRPSFGGGGGGGRPNFSGGGGGGGRPNVGGGAGGGGAGRPNFGGGGGGGGGLGGGSRPNIGGGNIGAGNLGGGNRPNIGGGNRPNIGGGNRPSTLPGERPNFGNGGNRPNIGGGNLAGGNRPSTLPAERPNFGGGNRPNIGGGNRPNIGGGIGNNTNIGNRVNIGSGNFNNVNFNNVHNNIAIASQRPYYGWQHGNWNGNWNGAGGNGYWNGWAHGYYHGYNNGYWNGGWGGYWHGGWGGGYWGMPWYASPITWGLGGWALGSIMYNSGYMGYSNPYYTGAVATTPAYYDYSQPITVINQQPATMTDAAPTPEVQEGTSHSDLARAAFKNGDYTTAMNEIDAAIKVLPRDAALHEFRALIFFAMKDYQQAAATLYAVLSAGPGWDWTTLSGMYGDVAVYTQQLRDLETTVKANPAAADAKFVLAYHYLTCGYSDSAAKQYKDVLALQPNNQLVTQLLTLLGNGPATSTSPSTQPTPDPTPSTVADSGNPPPAATETQPQAPTPIDPKAVVGNWSAKRPDGSNFSLKITDDGKFTWGFTQGNNKQEFGGKYSVDGAVLVLERSDGAQMPGLITMADKGFNFKLYGGPPDDQGLDFQK